jgi:hypothetical protein
MAFTASNNKITVTDADGSLVFTTDRDIPQILQVSQTHLSKDFYEKYYTEEYQKVCDLPDEYDFIICRAACTSQAASVVPDDWGTGVTAGNYVVNDEALAVIFSGQTGATLGNIVTYSPSPGDNSCELFIAGSTTLQTAEQRILPWARVAQSSAQFFQGSLMLETGYGVWGYNASYQGMPYANRALHVYKPDWAYQSLYAMFQQSVDSAYPYDVPPTAHTRWDVDLTVWIGRFK